MTYYGFNRTRMSHSEAPRRTLREGIEMVRSEFYAFLVGRETARRRGFEVMASAVAGVGGPM
ncbi:hypothetical protein HS1genome_1694 [Sulfodiicoccus acidiphilus]|uniref:Uncharacterized protein n=1 Tax=Sulfodiicoccus acidiphilus TaxID=1670455 RepID=A0A348B553_9CREN|nr:hypothetical protein [Sulfodiicoccus acidiphilus]BBD73305.1 hypothetical protein HS1genome_1694 [Sulfodiicoccus acidiphilus]GGT89239.1 hypothetical protein GCM10007116_03850 [Sulfodiicoccus acidiphilus]